MKKSWYLTAIACILLVGCGFCVLLWPRTVPFSQCSDLYKKYAKADGINASFVMDYRINDSVSVDVTLLEATDSNGWKTLKRDFCLPNLNQDFQRRNNIKKERIFTRSVNKKNYCEPADEASPDCEIIAISFSKCQISIFHISNPKEKHAVLYYNFEKSINQKT